MNLNKKGSSTLTSFILYIFISIAVLAIVTTSATTIVRDLKQDNNYKLMINSINKIENTLIFVSQNKHNYTDLTIKNPETLIIDCINNKIIGVIRYDKKYTTEPLVINNVTTYKKENNIYFEKDLAPNINLECHSLYLNTGENKLKANYFSYDPITGKTNVDILRRNSESDNYWYNSKWNFRKKITIDHTTIDEDLIDFPVLIKIDPVSIYEPNYYIEDDGTNKYFWTKITLNPYETKTLKITKENGFYPDGENVFEFFDDFNESALHEKWFPSVGSTYVLSGGSISVNTGGIGLNEPLPIDLKNNYIVRARAKVNNHSTSYGSGGLPGINSIQFYQSNNAGSDALITLIKQSSTSLNQLLYSATGSAASYDITSALIVSTMTLDQYDLYDTVIKQNSFSILKNESSIYDSSTVNFTKELRYISIGTGLGGNQDRADTEYDYIFVRKYADTEPSVVVTNENAEYLVTITNNSSNKLTNHQIKVSGSQLDISSKEDSLKIETPFLENKMELTKDLSFAKSDGSDIVFTTNDGKTKLKREIEYINTVTKKPYYIEEQGAYYYVWIKTDLQPYQTKTYIIKKTEDDSPNGDEIFEFFEDFDQGIIDESKWGYLGYPSSTTSIISETHSPGNLYLYNSYIISKNPIESNKKIFQLRYKPEYVSATADSGYLIMGESFDKSYTSNRAVLLGETISTNNFQIYNAASCSPGVVYSSAIPGIFSTYLNFEGMVNSSGTQVRQKVYYDGEHTTLIDDSNWRTPNASCLRQTGFFGLRTDTTNGRVYYDYAFVRKYAEIEPTVVVTKKGDYYLVSITNNINETLTDYQVRIPGQDLEIFSKDRSLEITDQGNSLYNNSLIMWVKVPVIKSDQDTEIYMYYGNQDGQEENDLEVWDNNFIMVQHLNESTENDVVGFIDSTSNNNNGVAKGFDDVNSTTNTIGKIGGANLHKIVLDGDYPTDASSNYIEFGTIYNNDWNYQTVSVWVNWTGETNGGYALPYGDIRYSNFGRFMVGSTGVILAQNQASGNTYSTNRVYANEFTHIVYRYNIDENKEYVFVNGQKQEKDREINIALNAHPLRLGYADAYAFSGIIDEFKVSNTARSDSWIKTEYLNQVDPYSFFVFSNQEGQ